MHYSTFQGYMAKGYSHIPVYKEILADLDTPLTLFMKLANRPYSYLLESVQGGEQWARYSMIGLSSSSRIELYGHELREIEAGEVIATKTLRDPLAYIDDLVAQYRVPESIDGLPGFWGGLVGYFAYDVIKLIEPVLQKGRDQIDELGVADILLMRSEEVVVVDNLSGKTYLIVMTAANQTAYRAAQIRLAEILGNIERSLDASTLAIADAAPQDEQPLSMSTEQQYKDSVVTIKQHIVDGDVFQVVTSHRMSCDYTGQPLDLYRALKTLNPSPYMYYLHLGDFHIVGASPEILVKIEQGKARVRPIAGTRPRGETVAEDLQLEKELLADPKEIAEHVMLIDLGRNDIGRIAENGAVHVNEQMVVERYSHVMHIVSNVVGRVAAGKTAMDVFKAVFPAGTLTGAPKVRAMEIINELEPVKRNVYGGAIGYLAWNGDMDTAITIRTAVIKDGKMYVQAGAGIVYDSDADLEWQETLNKAASLIKAKQMISR